MSEQSEESHFKDQERWPRIPVESEAANAPPLRSPSPPSPARPSGVFTSGTFWSALGTVLTLLSVLVAAWQLIDLNRGAKVDRANSAVQHFLASQDIRSISKSIAAKTQMGANYEAALTDPELRSDLIHYLNPLEMIAGGVNSGIYSEEVVRYNLAETIYKQVTAHLNGKPGTFPSGEHWFSNSKSQPVFPSRDEFPELRKLYKRWFPSGEYVLP